MAETLPVEGGMQLSRRGLEFRNLVDLKEYGQMVLATNFVPKGMTLASAVVSIQYGMEVGLTPMQALQSIAVINGRPAIFGDAIIGLILASGLLEDMDEHFEKDPKMGLTAVCTMKRRGIKTPKTHRFSQQDAVRAGLWGKQGPWTSYPKRMLQMRARSWCARDIFGDILKGLISSYEAQDFPANEGLPQGGGNNSKIIDVSLDDVFSRGEAEVANNQPAAEVEEKAQEPIGEEVSQSTSPSTGRVEESVPESNVEPLETKTKFGPTRRDRLMAQAKEMIDGLRELKIKVAIPKDMATATDDEFEKYVLRLETELRNKSKA